MRSILAIAAAALTAGVLTAPTAPAAVSHNPLAEFGTGIVLPAKVGGKLKSIPPRVTKSANRVAGPPLPVAAIPTVGRLYFDTPSGPYKCTAAIVPSVGGNLVATAGHCLARNENEGDPGYYTNFRFMPGYTGTGGAPYGVFKGKTPSVLVGWAVDRNPNYDYGFLVLEKNDQGQSVEAAVGKRNGISFGQPAIADRTIWGYNAANDQIACRGQTTYVLLRPWQVQMDGCAMPAGASGGPWFMDYNSSTQRGLVNGVSSTANVSSTRTPLFDEDTQNLWQMNHDRA